MVPYCTYDSAAYFLSPNIVFEICLSWCISRKLSIHFTAIQTIEFICFFFCCCYIGCFQSLTFANNAAINVLGHVSLGWKSCIVEYAHLQLYVILWKCFLTLCQLSIYQLCVIVLVSPYSFSNTYLYQSFYFFLINLFYFIYFFGCVGSSLLHVGFL